MFLSKCVCLFLSVHLFYCVICITNSLFLLNLWQVLESSGIYITVFFSLEYDVIGLWVQTAVKTSEGSTHNAPSLQTDKNLGPSLHRQEETDSFRSRSSAMPHLLPRHTSSLTPTNAQSLSQAHATFVLTSSAIWGHLMKHIQVSPSQSHSGLWESKR